MPDWGHLGVHARATGQKLADRLALPLLVNGPSKLHWDWTLVDADVDVDFKAIFTAHGQAPRTLSHDHARAHTSCELTLESRGELILTWVHAPTFLQLLGGKYPRLAYRIWLCTMQAIQQDEEEQARVNARIIQQHVPQILE